MIICHTKELCSQVVYVLEKFNKGHKKFLVAKAIGGKEHYGKVPIGHVVVGTIGKIK